MPGDTTPVEPSSPRISGDFLCFACGYNLRTLTWDGRCPECGQPVRNSAPPPGFHFASRRRARRTQVGIGIWSLALALSVVAPSIFTLVWLVGGTVWYEPGAKHSLAGSVFRITLNVWMYGDKAAFLLNAVAVLLIVAPFARGGGRSRSWLGVFTGGFAGVSAACTLLLLLPIPQASITKTIQVLLVIVGAVAVGCLRVSQGLLWVHLATLIDCRTRPRMRRITCILTAAPVLVAAGAALRMVVEMTNPLTWVPLGTIVRWSDPVWWTTLNEMTQSWDAHGHPACLVVMLLMLWFYVRSLNAGLIQPK